jgi:hypothetical protein
MKTKNLFLATMVLLFGVVFKSSGQGANLVLPGNNTTTGGWNVILGPAVAPGIPINSGGSITNQANVFIGSQAASSTTTNSTNNVFVGYDAGYNCTDATSNVFVGSGSGMYYHKTLTQNPNYNTCIGTASGGGSAGSENVSVGYAAGSGNSGDSNVFFGFQSGYSNSGSNNVFLGYKAG